MAPAIIEAAHDVSILPVLARRVKVQWRLEEQIMLCRIIISVDASSFLCNFFDLVVSVVASFDAVWIIMIEDAVVVKDMP